MTQFIMAGLTIGAIYAIVALGFTLIFSSSHVINFAQGEFVMIGGMATAMLHAVGMPLLSAALIAIVIASVVGMLVYELAIRPARTRDPVIIIIITIGVSIFIKGVSQIVLGKQLHTFPGISGDISFEFLDATVTAQALWVLLGVGVIALVLFCIARFTLIGKAFIAMSTNAAAAVTVGINPRSSLLLCFAISAAIGSVGGILATPITATSFEIGTTLALKGFAAAVLGGLGNAPGALVGGLTLGVLESLAAGYLSSTYKDAVAYFVIILILLIFPHGLLSLARHERV